VLYYSHGIDLSRRGENYTNFQGLICKQPYKLASVLLITSCTDFPVINFLKILSVPITYFWRVSNPFVPAFLKYFLNVTQSWSCAGVFNPQCPYTPHFGCPIIPPTLLSTGWRSSCSENISFGECARFTSYIWRVNLSLLLLLMVIHWAHRQLPTGERFSKRNPYILGNCWLSICEWCVSLKKSFWNYFAPFTKRMK
jgi:hypothetical protein